MSCVGEARGTRTLVTCLPKAFPPSSLATSPRSDPESVNRPMHQAQKSPSSVNPGGHSNCHPTIIQHTHSWEVDTARRACHRLHITVSATASISAAFQGCLESGPSFTCHKSLTGPLSIQEHITLLQIPAKEAVLWLHHSQLR